MVNVYTPNTYVPQEYIDALSTPNRQFCFIAVPEYKKDDESGNIIQKEQDVKDALSLISKVRSYNMFAKSITAEGVSFFYL